MCGPPRVRPVGRYEELASGGIRVSNPGSGVVARFRGREVAVRLRETLGNREYHGRYLVRIDGRELETLATEPGRERYVLASDLGPGDHVVELLRRTEAFVSAGEFLGFDFGPMGVLLAPPCEQSRKILFLGDSVTAAFGVLGDGPHCDFRPESQDFFSGYAAEAASRLGAEVHTALWSGHGVMRNYDGATVGLIPDVFERAVASDDASSWDHGRFSPDLVFVLAGANDFGQGTPDEAQFVSAYAAFVRRIRSVHPSARVMLGLSPMLNDRWPEGQEQRSTVRRFIERVARETGAAFFEFDEQREEDGVGCTWHPSARTHQKMAEKLVGAVRRTMRW